MWCPGLGVIQNIHPPLCLSGNHLHPVIAESAYCILALSGSDQIFAGDAQSLVTIIQHMAFRRVSVMLH